jgi:glycosyltransferase involved in cell wall biosynthesis
MKNKQAIKVYLQYPWKFPDSPYYKYLVENPPENIAYLNAKKQSGAITKKNKFLFSNRLKKTIRKMVGIFHPSMINSHLSPDNVYDLIHCAHCLSKNKNKPWVADFEGWWQMYVSNKTNKSKEEVRKILMSNDCKKIIPWTEATKKEILKDFPEIKNKLEVVYPAVPLKIKQKKKNEKTTILYATRYFWLKGGIIALEVYRRLKQKYGDKIELIFISDVPKEIKSRYPELEIKDLVPQEELCKFYENSDIFFYPSFTDTFGFGLLEAMSFGLPIITVNTFQTKTRKEIINNNQGIIFGIEDEITKKVVKQKGNLLIGLEEQKIVNKLFSNCCMLIENKKIREKLSKNCIEEIKKGKFSIKERNQKLKRIYEEALK